MTPGRGTVPPAAAKMHRMEAPTPHDGSTPRRAATIVLARDAQHIGAVDVLVLRRSAGARFVPGFVVFPGGAVDPADRDRAARWFGARDEDARACAVRELAEEAGVLLTADGAVAARPGGGAWTGGDLNLRTPIAIDRLPQIGRWIAPEFLDDRFDARFFAAAVEGDLEPTPDAEEAEAAWWARPSDVLEGQRTGDVQLAWPTFKTLEALAACGTVADVLALRIEQVAPPVGSHVGPRPPDAVSTRRPARGGAGDDRDAR